MPKRQQPKPQQPKTDEYMRMTVQSFVANMIDEYDRTEDMKEPVYPETLPDDMPQEKAILTCVYDCAARQIPPTRDNVIKVARILYQADGDKVTAAIDDVLTKQTADHNVSTMSVWVFEDFKRRRIEDAQERANHELDRGVGTKSQRLERAAQILAEVMEYQDDSYVKRSQAELGQHMIEFLTRQQDIRESGKVTAPTLKFKGFVGERDKKTNMWLDGKEGLIPFLRWGQTTLITGPTGGGKTSIGGVLAEHNAWELGFDVAYFHNETEQETFGLRQLSRNLLIPSDYLMNALKMKDPDSKAAKAIREFYEKKATAAGTIHYIYCPGWSAQKINAAIALLSRECARRGTGLLTFMDYYNLVDNSMFYGEEPSRLGQVALALREGTKKENIKAQRAGGLGVHSIVFAQETETKGGEKYAYGSRQIVQYSQLHISIERTMAELPTIIKTKDFLGHLRHMSKTGEWSHVTKLNVLKANDNSKGKVEVWIENAMSKVHEPVGAAKNESQNQEPTSLQSNPN